MMILKMCLYKLNNKAPEKLIPKVLFEVKNRNLIKRLCILKKNYNLSH